MSDEKMSDPEKASFAAWTLFRVMHEGSWHDLGVFLASPGLATFEAGTELTRERAGKVVGCELETRRLVAAKMWSIHAQL